MWQKQNYISSVKSTDEGEPITVETVHGAYEKFNSCVDSYIGLAVLLQVVIGVHLPH